MDTSDTCHQTNDQRSGKLSPSWSKWMMVSIAVLATVWAWVPSIGSMVFDDAFITYRYAYNLATYGALEYNIGEQVQGFTTPLWTLLLSFASVILDPKQVPAIASILSTALFAGSCILVCHLMWPVTTMAIPQLLSVMLFLILTFSEQHVGMVAVSGMETGLLMFLLLMSVSLFVKGRISWSAIASGAVVLTRPDGVLVPIAIVLVAGFLRYRVRDIARFLSLAFAMVLPWLAFSWLYYGQPIPNSIIAKASIASLIESPVISKIKLVVGFFSSPVWSLLLWAMIAITFGLCGLFILRRFGERKALQPHTTPGTLVKHDISHHDNRFIGVVVSLSPLLLSLGVLWILYTVAYVFTPTSIHFMWYFVPLIFIRNVLVAISLYLSIATLSRIASPIAAGAAGLVLLIAIFAFIQPMPSYSEKIDAIDQGWTDMRSCAEWLKSHSHQADRIHAQSIGIVGFYSQRYILDNVGIVSPLALRYGLDNASTASLISTQRPRWIVTFYPELVYDSTLKSTYTAAKRCGQIYVFKRVQ